MVLRPPSKRVRDSFTIAALCRARWSASEIRAYLGVSKWAVRWACERYNVKPRGRSGARPHPSSPHRSAYLAEIREARASAARLKGGA